MTNLPAPRSLTLHELAGLSVPGIMRIRVEGLTPPPREGPLLVMVNRCSLLDPWLLALAAKRPIQMGIETPLFGLPGLASLASRLNTVALPKQDAIEQGDRDADAQAAAAEYAAALDRGHAVALFVTPELRETEAGLRYVLPPTFLNLLLVTREERIPVMPALAVGRGRRLNVANNPILGRLMRASTWVADPSWPPVLYSENVLRIGQPVYWRDGGENTLQTFAEQVETSLAALF